MMLNIYYEEPDEDRWVPLDRYPRRIVRRLLRGPAQPGGQKRVFLNLCAGLERIGVSYRVNDYRWAKLNPAELVCIVGKPHVLNKMSWRNPILFGAACYSHPVDDPSLLQRLPVKKVLVPGPWMKRMCQPYWGDAVEFWPVGIDTDRWKAAGLEQKTIDVLLYDKVRWEHDRFAASLINPIREFLRTRGHSICEVRYGFYREEDFRVALAQCRTMVFLCEHESQGIAYQQALSCDVPILAWDRGGFWQDPSYYPDRVEFGPVTSVPYWDDRCGLTFSDFGDFPPQWERFWEGYRTGRFRAREFIIDTLTLERCARRYVELARVVT
jgi:glycosyltransferase involved in cell wall biosynthesis